MTPERQGLRQSLLALPNEIQSRILFHLVPSSVKSVHAVLYTCKHLYQIALPFSVHTYRNATAPISREFRTRSRNLQFLHYITITKPELARHVRALVFGNFSTRDSDDELEYEQVGPTDDEKPIYRGLVDKTFTAHESDEWEAWRQDWISDLEEGYEDAEVALLLVACKGLQQLCYGEPYHPRTFLRVLRVAIKKNLESQKPRGSSPTSLPLSCLDDVYHESEETKYGYLTYLEQTVLLFQLPSIRSYECILPNGGEGEEKSFEDILPRSSSVEEIILRRGAITAGVLRATIGACEALRSFEFLKHPTHMYDLDMMPSDLLGAILPHQKTLEYLHADFMDSWSKVGWSEYPEKLFMGRELKQMTALKKLVTGMQALTGRLASKPEYDFGEDIVIQVEGAPRLTECIPENLEHLEIHSCGSSIVPQVQELLDLCSTGKYYSQLKRVRLLFIAKHTKRSEVKLECRGPSPPELDIVFSDD
ncbi:f-box domain-containing [Fusarium albosuccineum]|uniref:F-box domain-containing n=1 Tax=Fusarium albosuccineum TaxID=1237068 RepID=A0A8H4L580_9HYPO|nr:f-box domain-containing [Fusarium albosuccineum]